MQKSAIIATNIIFLFGALIQLSCVPKPVEIDYGSDSCSYCKMTIVDPKFGAELVSDKGKVYKFDAIECMVNYDNEFTKPVQLYLVNAFNEPGILYPAEACHFLIAQSVPSPMGANLSAYNHSDIPEKIVEEEGGKLLQWDDLRTQLIANGIVH